MGVGLSRWSLVAVILSVFAVLLASSLAEAGGGSGGLDLGWIPGGLVADSIGDEFSLDTEISRRILQTSGYISYGALSRDRVPCSLRGASYYNCRPGAQANPYSRGCSAITRCRTS